jgi:adenosyl cobinamide kinase/adenosyl cobinamide phosphate guanylyltransferase
LSAIFLITGGARSGKSRYAELLASHFATNVLYIATLEPSDPEMQTRIVRHQSRRPESWRTLETKFDIAQAISKCAEEVILIDCISGFVTNLVLRYEKDGEEVVIDKTLEAVDELVKTLEHSEKIIIMVTNEVGDGVVPEYPLGRWFRDALGLANQRLAKAADTVVLVTVGIQQVLKGELPIV